MSPTTNTPTPAPEPTPTPSPESTRTHEPTGPHEPPRTAVVTGAGRGIGRGLALGLATEGYAVALVGRTVEHLDTVAAEIGDLAHTVVVPVDLVDGPAVRAAAARIEDAFAGLGGVGLLVNNAGVVERAELPFAEDDVEDSWRVIETNLRGPMLITHALLGAMVARGSGRIVNINSGSGHRGAPIYTGYGISKGALARLTTMLDTQYREQGLRVFDVAPGVVSTDMTRAMPLHDDRTEWTPVEAVVELVTAIGSGRLDALSGRFFRSGEDTPDELAARADEILGADARRLRLVGYGPTDPLRP